MNNIFTAEMVGTAILVLLGDGVVAGVVLAKSKANGSGWIVITTGWGLAVAMAVYAVTQYSGAHLNPVQMLGSPNGRLWRCRPVHRRQFVGIIRR